MTYIWARGRVNAVPRARELERSRKRVNKLQERVVLELALL